MNSAYDIPPPIIQIGPMNQTVAVHSTAILPCRAVGDPPPTIKWYKDSTLLTKQKNERITQISDTLQIAGKAATESTVHIQYIYIYMRS